MAGEGGGRRRGWRCACARPAADWLAAHSEWLVRGPCELLAGGVNRTAAAVIRWARTPPAGNRPSRALIGRPYPSCRPLACSHRVHGPPPMQAGQWGRDARAARSHAKRRVLPLTPKKSLRPQAASAYRCPRCVRSPPSGVHCIMRSSSVDPSPSHLSRCLARTPRFASSAEIRAGWIAACFPAC